MTRTPLSPEFTPDFSHVETWVFDLDNTLYPPETRLFDQINLRMTDWVMRVAGVDRLAADTLRHTATGATMAPRWRA